MDDVAENCDALAVFSEGRVVMTGTPEEVFSRRKELEELRLDVPVTRKIADALAEKGLGNAFPLRSDDFVRKVAQLYRGKRV